MSLKKFIFVEGPACLGKTSCIKNGITNDFYENTLENPQFLNKRNDKTFQMLYQIKYFKKLLQTDIKENKILVDRSPFADVIYNTIFKVMNLTANIRNDSVDISQFLNKVLYENTYDNPNKILKAMNFTPKMWDTIFDEEFNKISKEQIEDFNFKIILPNIKHFTTILEKMIERDNKIDIYTLEYVIIQCYAYQKFITHFNLERSTFYIPENVKMYSEEYFKQLTNFLNDVEEEEEDYKVFSANTSIQKSYPEDAGFNLSSKENISLTKGVPIKILLNEKIFIPKGYYGSIHTNSRHMLNFNVTTSIFDAGYTGDWKVVIFPYEDRVILKNEIICQVVINRKEDIIIQLGDSSQEEEKYTRKSNAFGSGGLFKIPYYEFYQKWSSQPTTPEQQIQMEKDEKNIIDF